MKDEDPGLSWCERDIQEAIEPVIAEECGEERAKKIISEGIERLNAIFTPTDESPAAKSLRCLANKLREVVHPSGNPDYDLGRVESSEQIADEIEAMLQGQKP